MLLTPLALTSFNRAIKALGGGKFDVAGKLSIKGTSRDVVVPMQLAQGC